MKTLLVLNGPNMNLLGVREPGIYGTRNYDDLCAFVRNVCAEHGAACVCKQTNHEGDLVDMIQDARGKFFGIVLNAAAYTHTSVAIRDAIAAVGVPTVEVHLSDTAAREDFRKVNFVRDVCAATFEGQGFESYAAAVRFLCERGETT